MFNLGKNTSYTRILYQKKLFFCNTNYIKVDIIVSDEEHECLGFSGAPKEHPPPERDCIFLKIHAFWSTPQSSPWSGKGSAASLALPPTPNTGGGCHILHIWSSTRLFPVPQSYPATLQTWGEAASSYRFLSGGEEGAVLQDFTFERVPWQ